MRAIFLIFTFLFLGLNVGLATKPKTVLPSDSTNIEARKPSQTQLNKYRKSPEYQYVVEVAPPGKGIIADLLNRVLQWINDFFYQSKYSTSRIVLLYLFLGGIAVFVILKLMGINVTALFSPKASSLQVPFDVFGEDLNTIDFKSQIDQALLSQNYRLAVRLLYLQMLKELSDKGLILWQANKTNRSYGYEIKPNLRQTFDTLTEQFEYAWYGEFPIDEKRFDAIRNKTIKFRQEIG
jgi:hypothetical protein